MKSKLTVGDLDGMCRPNHGLNEEASELFLRHGALWLEDVFTVGFVDQLAEAYRDRYSSLRIRELKRNHALVGDHRFMVTVDVEAPFNSPTLYGHPFLIELLSKLLGADFLISSFGSVFTFPGADAQAIHFDHHLLHEKEEDCIKEPPHAITVVIPLVDLTSETGSTAIWEGSHAQIGARDKMLSLQASPDWTEASIPLAKRGDCYLMDYRVIHGGLPNRSEVERPILYIVYSRSWFKDEYNFNDQPPLRIAAAELEKVPAALRGLFANVQTHS